MKGDRKRLSQSILVLFLTGLLLNISSAGVTAENDDEAYFSPDALSVGTVCQGSVIEANFSMNNIKKVYSVDHPPWITIREIIEDTSYHFSSCDIYLTVDTSQTGNFSGEVVVETDNGDITLPVSVSVRNSPKPSVKLLITDTLFERSSTSDSSRFNEVTRIITENYIDVDYREQIPSDLSEYDVILVAEGVLWDIASIEVCYLHHFIEDGGTVIVCADPFFIGTVCSANEIIEPYGLKMKNDIYEEFIIDRSNISPHELTEGVNTFRIHRPSLIYKIGGRGKFIVTNPENPHEGFVAMGEHNGAVIVFGNSLWWLNLAESTEYDNSVLFRNMMTYVKPPPSIIQRLNSPLFLRVLMIVIGFVFAGYPFMKKMLYKESVKTEHKFLVFLMLSTVMFYGTVINTENLILMGLSISLLFSSILFSLILVQWKRVILYLFLSAFIVGTGVVTFEGEYTLISTLPIAAFAIFVTLLLYTLCLVISLFPLKYSKRGKHKLKFVISTFLSWLVAYWCIVFFEYISYSYNSLLETAIDYTPLFVPVVVVPIAIYFIYDKLVQKEPKISSEAPSEVQMNREVKK